MGVQNRFSLTMSSSSSVWSTAIPPAKRHHLVAGSKQWRLFSIPENLHARSKVKAMEASLVKKVKSLEGRIGDDLEMVEMSGSSFGKADEVPAINYILSSCDDINTKLCIIDSLEKLGVQHHFKDVIQRFLDEIYRLWMQNDEQMHSEMITCAMAFRILRMHGYVVSSRKLERFDEDGYYCNSTDCNLNGIGSILELYKASQIKLFQDEEVLGKLNLRSFNFLKQKCSLPLNDENEVETLRQEVDHALRFQSYSNLERIEHRRNIENFYFPYITAMNTSPKFQQNIDMDDILSLAVKDFNTLQSMYQSELILIESWVKETKLDELKFARQKEKYCYFSAAATHFLVKMSDVRISWAKSSILTTLVDDFFDIGSSKAEQLNFIQLVERWDEDYSNDCCSQQVHTLFSALYTTINELGAKASLLQGRDVKSHIIEIWLDLVNAMKVEADWLRSKTVPTLGQYMTNGCTSFALGPIILPTLYFVGPKIPCHVIKNLELHNLFRLVSTCGRILNDIQGFQREGKEGKLNGLALRVLHGGGKISEEVASREMMNIVETTRTELLRLVLQEEGSVIPTSCKELFWKMSKILHVFYARNDGFSSPTEMMRCVNDVLFQPLRLP